MPLDSHYGAILPVYLRITNPLRVIDDGGLACGEDLADAAFKEGAINTDEFDYICEKTDFTTPEKRLFAILSDKGYDGLVYQNTVEGNGDSWVPFKPEQIKSVFNKGSFNVTKKDISEDLSDVTDDRMQRAKAMGFTIPAFHGTGATFNEFSVEKGKPSMMGGHAPHFADSKDEADGYAKDRRKDGENAKVIHVLLRVNNPLIIDMYRKQGIISTKEYKRIVGKKWVPGPFVPYPSGYDALRDLEDDIGYEGDRKDHWNQVYAKLMKLGYDGLKYINMMPDYSHGNYTKYVVFDPKNIRSIDAAFMNPESRNIFEANMNDAFNRWFGNSKVVDAAGNPLVVYHGTSHSFNVFDSDKTMDSAFWFTTNKKAIESGEVGASGHGKIMPVYLSVKKLAGWDEYDKYTFDQLIQMGFDGIKLDDNYVVFSPSQIKSVSNRGDWDGGHPNILR